MPCIENAITGWTARYGDVRFADPAATEVAADAVNTGAWPSKSKKAMGKVGKLAAGKRSLTVSMKRVTGGKAYRVYYRQAGAKKYKSKLVKRLTSKNSTKTTVTCTVKGLKKGKRCQVATSPTRRRAPSPRAPSPAPPTRPPRR